VREPTSQSLHKEKTTINELLLLCWWISHTHTHTHTFISVSNKTDPGVSCCWCGLIPGGLGPFKFCCWPIRTWPSAPERLFTSVWMGCPSGSRLTFYQRLELRLVSSNNLHTHTHTHNHKVKCALFHMCKRLTLTIFGNLFWLWLKFEGARGRLGRWFGNLCWGGTWSMVGGAINWGGAPLPNGGCWTRSSWSCNSWRLDCFGNIGCCMLLNGCIGWLVVKLGRVPSCDCDIRDAGCCSLNTGPRFWFQGSDIRGGLCNRNKYYSFTTKMTNILI